MHEKELVQATFDELTDIYGEDRVVVEPTIEGKVTFRPDIAVLDEAMQDFYLIVECSALISQHREREDLKQVRRLMEAIGAPYGALVSGSLHYVFELVDREGEKVERELASYPDGDSQQRRALESAEEIRFKFYRLAENFRSIASFDLVNALYRALFRKLAAERHDYMLDIDTLSQQDLEEIDELIQDEYPPYKPQVGPEEVEFQRQVLNTFHGIDLGKTSRDLAHVFVELADQEKSGFQSTPLWVTESLVDLAEVGESDQVLDPAAGFGNVAREANIRGSDSYAVEINVDAANCGLFLNELFDTDVSYALGDFFELNQEEDFPDDFPQNFDYGFIDPPFNLRYERSDGTVVQSGDEKFVLDTLERVKPGGVATVILPAGKLFKKRASDFREKIRSEYSIRSIVELNSPIYDRTRVPTVILQIVNELPSESEEVPYVVIDGEDDPERKLPEAVDDIRLGKTDTLPMSRLKGRSFLPSEITQLDKTGQKLRREYSEVREIQSVADEIRGGTKKPDEVFESSGPDRLPYVNISDVQNNAFSEYLEVTGNTVVADKTDVLLSVTGAKIHVHHPSKEIAPSSMWAVIRFSTEEEALVYAHFLDTELAQQQLESMQGGATIQHIPIRRLRETLVPDFSDSEIEEKAEAVRKRLDRLAELEEQQEELEDDLEDLFGGE